MKKKKRSPIREHDIEKLSSLLLEKKDKSNLKIINISASDKANLGLEYNQLVKFSS